MDYLKNYKLTDNDINEIKDNIDSQSYSLLLDEEEDIIMECFDILEEDIVYEKKEEYPKEIFLTREELFKRSYLLKEIENAYKDKLYIKILYYYEEVFENDDKPFISKYKRLVQDIKDNYNEKYNSLYEIVRMSYIGKK